MSEVMDPVTVIVKIRREITSQMEALVQTLANGGVDSMTEYKYIIGKVHALDQINQEISNLLEPKEPEPHDTNVTRIRK